MAPVTESFIAGWGGKNLSVLGTT